MSSERVQLALREITGTKRLLEPLIQSTDSFDYPAAKAALLELDRTVRRLARLHAEVRNRPEPPWRPDACGLNAGS